MSQLQCTAALLKTKCIPHWLCCSAKQADSSLVSLQRHLWIFLQYTGVQCPITNALQCTAALLKTKVHSSLPCVALQNRLTAGLCHCKDTFGYSFETQVCSVPSPMHYSTGQGKSHSSLPRVTLQNRLTAGLCHCKDTFGYSFETQVCSVPSPMHYSTCQGKSHSSLPRVALQNKLTAGLCHCK